MAARSPSTGPIKKKRKRKAKAKAPNSTKKSKKRVDKLETDATSNAATDVASNAADTGGSTNDTSDKTAIESAVENDPLSRRTFLDYFWTLASTDQSDRVGAANGIVSFLVAEQAKPQPDVNEDDVPAGTAEEGDAPSSAAAFGTCRENLRYALKRLVKGLQSSRAGARQGFSLALVGILQHPTFSELVSIKEVLSFGNTVLDYTVMKKRHEARECMFGKVFLYMAVHRSQRLTDPDDIVHVTENLVVLAHKKPFLREICLETVGEIATAAPVTFCRDTILPIVVRDIAGLRKPQKDVDLPDDADPLGPEELSLAFVLRSRFGKLKPHKDSPSYSDLQALFHVTDNNSIDSWLEPLKASSGVFPRVHSVWTHILEAEAQSDKTKESKKKAVKNTRNKALERCLSVWHTVVEPHFFRGNSHERKYLGFKLMHRFLEWLQRHQHHDHCAQLLTPNLLSCVYNNVMDDSALLHDAAVNAVQALLTQPPLVRVTAAVSLVGSARRTRPKASSDVGKNLIEQLLSYTKEAPDAVQEEYLALLRTYTVSPLSVVSVSGSDEEEKQKNGEQILDQADERRIRAIAALAKAVRSDGSFHSPERHRAVLHTLCALTFFSFKASAAKQLAKLETPLKVPAPPLTSKSRAVCRKHFFMLLGDQKTDTGFQHLYDLHAMLKKLLGCKRGVSVYGEGAEEWSENKEALTTVQTQLLKSAKQLSTDGKGGSSGQKDIRRGMECLLLHVALHQYEHPSQFTQAGTELILCSKNITSPDAEARDKARAVLVDIVLMLLNETAIADTNMRSAINHSWRLLCFGGSTVVNATALEELLRVLTLDAKSLYANEEDDSEGEPISEEDDDEDESEDEEKPEAAAEEKDKPSAKDEDDEEADDDDDDDDEKEDEAEADAEENSEDEEEEEDDDDVDDDDDDDDESDRDLEARAIATMLRLRREQKRSKAELKQRAIHFKLRVVDLLETFIAVNNKLEQDETRPEPSLPGLVSILGPLLKATQILQRQVHAGKGHKETRSLMERLASLFNKKLCKAVVKSTRGGKPQHGPKDGEEVVKAMSEVLDVVLESPNKAKHEGSDMAGTAVAFLFRVLQTLGCGHEGAIVDGAREQMTRVVKCCLLTKNPKFKIKFLELQAVRSPLLAWATLLPPLGKICAASEGEWCPRSPYQRVQCIALIDLVLKSYRQLFNRDQAVATKLLAPSYDLICGGVACYMELCCQDVEAKEGGDTKEESQAKYLLKAKRLKVVLKLGNTLLRVWQEKLRSTVPPSCFSRVQSGIRSLVALRGPGTAGDGVACRSEKVHSTLQQFGSTLNKAIGTDTPVSKSKTKTETKTKSKTPKKRKNTAAINTLKSSAKKIKKRGRKTTRGKKQKKKK